jgi:DNA-binding GntR family transcriptional regulator
MINLKQHSLKTQIYTTIKKRLLDQVYQDGQILTERKLSEELNVSRTPVREAMQRLQKEGWVRYVRNKGIIVKSLDASDLLHIFQIRLALEMLAVKLACPRINSDQIQLLRLSLEQQAGKREGVMPDYQKFMMYDTEFHNIIIDAAGNMMLRSIIEEMRDKIRRTGINSLYSRKSRIVEAVAEHTAVVDALEKRDADLACTAMQEHLAICYSSAHEYIVRPEFQGMASTAKGDLHG